MLVRHVALDVRERTAAEQADAISGAAAGLCELGGLADLPPVSAADLEPLPGVVRLRPEIEPLVRLLEDTPRERLLEVVAARVRSGVYVCTLSASGHQERKRLVLMK